MYEFHIFSYVNDDDIKIKTHSWYEAQIIFIYKFLKDINDGVKNLHKYYINVENILCHYYYIKNKDIPFIKYECNKFYNAWNIAICINWKDNINIIYEIKESYYKQYVCDIMKYVNLKIPNFVDKLKSKDPKFFKECI